MIIRTNVPDTYSNVPKASTTQKGKGSLGGLDEKAQWLRNLAVLHTQRMLGHVE